jgi:hypothetical protein
MTSRRSINIEGADRLLNGVVKKCFVGNVRVDISALEFFYSRQLEQKIVKNLKSVFQQSGCRRYDPRNYIPALVTPAVLGGALRTSKRARGELKIPEQDGTLCFLRLDDTQKLSCLDGFHRTQAAQEFLDTNDRWWTVRLFEPKTQKGRLFYM